MAKKRKSLITILIIYIIDLAKSSIKKSTKKKYESLNIVSETGDSIYTVSMEELAAIDEGQVYISLSEIKRVVNEEWQRRLGPSQKNNF